MVLTLEIPYHVIINIIIKLKYLENCTDFSILYCSDREIVSNSLIDEIQF